MAFITDLTAAVPTTGAYIDGLPSGVDNRQGSIRGGGTIADSTNFATTSFGEGNPITTIVSGVGGAVGTNDALPSTAWNSGVQVMSLDQTIAGAANTALQGGSSNSANEAYTPPVFDHNEFEGYKAAVRAGWWNVFNGTWSSGPATYVLRAWDIAGDAYVERWRSNGVDHAGNPTQNEPGEIVIRDGSANPVQTGYQPRNNW